MSKALIVLVVCLALINAQSRHIPLSTHKRENSRSQAHKVENFVLKEHKAEPFYYEEDSENANEQVEERQKLTENVRGFSDGTEHLTFAYDTVVYGQFTLGTPPQNFLLSLSTSIGDLSVPGKKCKTLGCLRHDRYNYKKSSTYVDLGQEVIISRGTEKEEGYLATDILGIAGYSVSNVTFLDCTYIEKDNYENLPVDGQIGLGMFDHSGSLETPIEKLWAQGLIEHYSFSFYLSSNPDHPQSSVMILGEDDEKYYEGHLVAHDMASEYLFLLEAQKLSFGSRSLEENVNILFEVAAPGIFGKQSLIDEIKKLLPSKITCESIRDLPDMVINFGGDQYVIPAADYVAEIEVNGRFICEYLLEVVDTEGYYDLMIGQAFIKSYYTKFDVENKKLWFAKAKSE